MRSSAHCLLAAILLVFPAAMHALVSHSSAGVPHLCEKNAAGVRPGMAPLPPIHVVASRPAQVRAQLPHMQDLPFWENVSRFARFSVTSITGLIAGLLAPFAAFARTPTLRAIGGSLVVFLLVFTYLTLTAMKGAPAPATTYSPPQQQGGQSAKPQYEDPSMRKMLQDIYGDY